MSADATKTKSTLWERIKQLGPALVLAAVVLGPGSITLSTIAGSNYGYQLLWVPIISTIFMIAFTWSSARVGLVTGKTILQVAREKYGGTVATIGGIFAYLSDLAFQAGNNAAAAFAADALLGGGYVLWCVVFFLLALGLVMLPNLYGKLELLVKVIVGILIVSFVGTVIIVGVDVPQAAAGLVPSFPDAEAAFTALGIAATTFSIGGAVYQSYLMQEKKWGIENLETQGFETFMGIGILGAVAIVVLLTSAGAIYGTGIVSANDMALQLEPLAGPGAFYLFTIGFFFASLSSLIVNPLIAATLLQDGRGKDPSMDDGAVKAWTAGAMLFGLGAALYYGGRSIELIRLAQGLSVVALPVLGFLIPAVAYDRNVMGKYASTTWVHAILVLGYVTMMIIVINNMRQIVNFL